MPQWTCTPHVVAHLFDVELQENIHDKIDKSCSFFIPRDLFSAVCDHFPPRTLDKEDGLGSVVPTKTKL